MKCPHCGKELNNSAVFCRYCGSKIEAAEEPHKDFTAKAAVEQEIASTASASAKKMDYGIFENARFIGIVIAIVAGIIIGVAIWNYKTADSTKIRGDWVVFGTYGTTENMYSELSFEWGRSVSLTSANYDDWDDGTYTIDEDGKTVNISAGNREFTYKFASDGTLILKEIDDDGEGTGEVGVYINMSEASEEQKEEYYSVSALTDEESVHDYLLGKWEEVEDKNDNYDSYQVSSHFFQYTIDEDDDGHIRYNLPRPGEAGEDFQWEGGNLITIGDEEIPAFLFLPRGYDRMTIYCYEDGECYDMERAY